MLLGKAVFIVAFNVGVYGLDWPWNWEKADVTCYTGCLAAVGTGAVIATPLAISAAGFGASGVVAGSLAAKVMSMIGVVKAGSWFAFLQTVGVTGVGTTGKMVLASTVSPMCAAVCGISEEKQDLKCHTRKIDGMKGLMQNLILAHPVENVQNCEKQCNDRQNCRAFQYLPKDGICSLYKSEKYIEDDDNESQFYTRGCILCYMNVIEKETKTVWKVSTFKECENQCIMSDDCSAVRFDGNKCFKFIDKMEEKEKTDYEFSTKMCIDFTDNTSKNHDNKYTQNGNS